MTSSRALSKEARVLKAAGNDAYRQQDFSIASEKYQAAIDESNDSTILYSNLAASLLAEGRLTAAIEASAKAIELDPTWFKPHVRLSGVYEKLLEPLKPLRPLFDYPENRMLKLQIRPLSLDCAGDTLYSTRIIPLANWMILMRNNSPITPPYMQRNSYTRGKSRSSRSARVQEFTHPLPISLR
ncbi:Dynein assembly factor 4, axonemal [Tulasnella sp. JGI-2019a]|nr:Dynein assembly factor 4, axonemal [Tulasnella sp. JGI-2019a]KAG9004931.1 Dynein assembly factor 4, axonemal [Tulasnella sp. JGI-2019a]